MSAQAKHRPARRARRFLARHPLPLALVAALAAPALPAQVLPTGGNVVVPGSATIGAPVNGVLDITQNALGAIIDWGDFSIGAGGTVNFVQPGSTSVILNRVIGTPGSQIDGSLNANGRVFLVNPNGIVFGADSQVNVGGLVASTLAISNADFNAGIASGRFVFNATSPGAGSISNLGDLVAGAQGTIALLAGSVVNEIGGSILAPGGTVALASSQQVTLDFFGDGLTQVTIDVGTDDGFVANDGLMQADGGNVQLRTQTPDGTPGGFGGFVENTGVIRARTLGNRNGRIVLDAGAGEVRVGATLRGQRGVTGATFDASGTGSGASGGTIELDGNSILITGARDAGACDATAACTLFDASGNGGGGSIQVHSVLNTSVFADGDSDAANGSVAFLADAIAGGTGGNILLDSQGEDQDAATPGVQLAGNLTLSASGLASGAVGGAIQVDGGAGSISLVDSSDGVFLGMAGFSADGGSGGGTIAFDAGGELVIDQFFQPGGAPGFGASFSADATASGDGGLVSMTAATRLDVRSVDVTAGGIADAGAWELESGVGLAIVDGADEFGPAGGVSLVSDDSIGGALSAGSDVDIVVPAPATGTAQVNIAPGVAIANTGTLPVALSLAVGQGQVLAGIGADGDPNGPWSITSSAGPLDLDIDALSSIGLFQGTVQTGGGSIDLVSRNSSTFGVLVDGDFDSGGGDIAIESLAAQDTGITIDTFSTIATGGGDLAMISGSSGGDGIVMSSATLTTDGGALSLRALDSGGVGVNLSFNNVLDTRVAQDAANAGGAILIQGNSRGELGPGQGVAIRNSDLRGSTGDVAITGVAQSAGSGADAGVLVDEGGEILSTSGDIGLSGFTIGGSGAGVWLRGNIFGSLGLLSSGSGDVSILGIGGTSGGAFSIGGIDVSGYGIQTAGGDIVLSGRGAADGSTSGGGPTQNNGLGLGVQAFIASNGGDILLSGSSEGSGAGILVSGEGADLASIDAGQGNIVLRAGNDGSAAALQIAGNVATGGVVDVRAGEVTAAGTVLDRNASTLRVGGGAGEFVSADSLANIDAPDLVIGHAGHAGAIAIADALARAGNLTLQNAGGAGGIALNAAVDLGSGTLALVSGGDITQTAAGGITAQSLLARSTGGSIDLTAGQNNVSGNTLAGGAAGDFGYIDVDTLAIGNVTARGFDAAGQAATGLAESGIDAGDAVFVRNNAGDLTLGADVSGTDVDLVTAARLQNVANATISAGNRWRVWADTWVGEQRGGLAGSGPLPNLFNCSFGGPCGVTVSAAEDHFIYRAQPTATIDIASFTRQYGLDNPGLLFAVSGLILGDQQANAILGVPGTTAVPGSDVGSYPIAGSFSSPAGYAIQINPGTATITPATLTYVADPFTLLFGQPFGPFTGTVTGFRNGDTLDGDTTGTLLFLADADAGAPPGVYPIFGSGLEARNYQFVQDPANFTALRVDFAPRTQVVDPIRESTDTYVYDRNIGQAPMCLAAGPLDGVRQDQAGDALGREWSKVRLRPNLTSCVNSERKNGCGDF